MAVAKIVVSVRDLEQVKLLLYQLKQLVETLDQADSPYKTPRDVSRHLERIVERFMGTRLEDDR